MTIRFDPARLVVTAVPKSGSTTLIAAFLVLTGYREEYPRRFLRMPGSEALLAERGLVITRMALSELNKLQSELTDYRFVTVMRDPAERLLSGYFNKINRYCKRYARLTYLWGKLRQFFAGPTAWGDINYGNRFMRARVSFDRFVAGLERHGIAWDNHFALQTHLAGTQFVAYQEIVALESLDTSLRDLLVQRGMDAKLLAPLSELPRFNATGSENDRQLLLNGSLRARIEDLYRKDYEFLGNAWHR